MAAQWEQTNPDIDAVRRARLFKRLTWRNRLVGFLRLGVPGTGLLVAGFLIFQIVLTNLARDYNISGLSVDKGQVVIDAPRYGGSLPDGSRYEVVAQVARVRVDAADLFDLEGVRITITQPDGYEMAASADRAVLDLSNRFVLIREIMHTKDSKNVTGELHDTLIDWTGQTLTARGPVQFDFADGARVQGQSLIFEGANSKWEFTGAVYTVPGDGEK